MDLLKLILLVFFLEISGDIKGDPSQQEGDILKFSVNFLFCCVVLCIVESPKTK